MNTPVKKVSPAAVKQVIAALEERRAGFNKKSKKAKKLKSTIKQLKKAFADDLVAKQSLTAAAKPAASTAKAATDGAAAKKPAAPAKADAKKPASATKKQPTEKKAPPV